MQPANRRSRAASAAALIALALWIGLQLAADWRLAPPPPRPASAPPEAFSARRAVATLARVLGDAGPHPLGSAAAQGVRARLVLELEALGLEPLVREHVLDGHFGLHGPLRNVLAELPGAGGERARERALLVLAHYDSVAAGPGVADDLAGVAALLELARALRSRPLLRHPVLLLFTDGEEQGLLGAEAFAAEDPAFQRVAAVLNVEARGTQGPSLLFETGPGSARAIAAFARQVPRPSASSVSAEVYRRMPNDTDFSVFRDRGLPGLNFAFIEGWPRYHTPLDSLEFLDAASVQHHGDQLLAAVTGLAGSALDEPFAGERVYHDLLGLVLLHWPASFAPFLGIGLAALWLLGLLRAAWSAPVEERPPAGLAAWLRALAALVLALAGPALAGAITAALAALRGVPSPWHADPLPARVALWAASLLALLIAGRVAGARGAAPLALLATALVATGAVWTGIALAGASYLFQWPLAARALALLAPGSARSAWRLALPLAAAVLVLAPVQLGVEAAFGLDLSPAISLPIALAGLFWVPLAARIEARAARGLAAGLAGVAALAFVLALLVPAFTEERPGHANLHYALDAEYGEARWSAWAPRGALPPGLAARFEPASVTERRAPWNLHGAWRELAPAPVLELAAPRFEPSGPLSGGRLAGRLVPGAGVERVFLRLAAREEDALASTYTTYGWHQLWGIPEEGQEFDLRLGPAPAGGELALELVGLRSGLPPEASELVALRARALHVPWSTGDLTLVVGRVPLERE